MKKLASWIRRKAHKIVSFFKRLLGKAKHAIKGESNGRYVMLVENGSVCEEEPEPEDFAKHAKH